MDVSRVPFDVPILDVYQSTASREPRSCHTRWEADGCGWGGFVRWMQQTAAQICTLTH